MIMIFFDSERKWGFEFWIFSVMFVFGNMKVYFNFKCNIGVLLLKLIWELIMLIGVLIKD